jgi:ATP-dependent DNA helicase RecQ
MKAIALNYLRTALNNPQAMFHEGQWESIEGLLARKKMLVVQRTGWGKSMVYFMATKLMREQGRGPTLIISPLLSLMRNQIEAANRVGIVARTINSTTSAIKNRQIQQELRANSVDILLISPERLGNEDFRQNVLSIIAPTIGLFVVDEAHCISDWGHDFRPDYRRIVAVLQALPSNIPVLATTATANDRVVNDVKAQLGQNVELIRGSLVRKSLQLQNITIPSQSDRMAWLAQTIPGLPGSGIVYTLTQRDAKRLTQWLVFNGISADVYHSDIPDDSKGTSIKEGLEQQLLNNQIKVLVATVALGMGFDKPDLGFVIHFQRPSSVVHYYQQVGRAGRAVNNAYGILLNGVEDDHIANFFIANAFPPEAHIADILNILMNSNDGLSVLLLQSQLNLSKSQINKTIKFLTVGANSPITKNGAKWYATAAANNYCIDQNHINSITEIRIQEQVQMKEYMRFQGCLMAFLECALDDPNPQFCGKCSYCAPMNLLSEQFDIQLANTAEYFLKTNYQKIKPRKQWPSYNPMPKYGFDGKIEEGLQASEGRALSLWRDAGWGELVIKGKLQDKRFSDELVNACVGMVKFWSPAQKPTWVTCIPSLKNPNIVPDFASRLAIALNLPFFDCIKIAKAQNNQQKFMVNSFQQTQNLDGVFSIDLEARAYSPCLLIDDIVASGWTLTVASALLRQVGCVNVYPLALALNSPKMD